MLLVQRLILNSKNLLVLIKGQKKSVIQTQDSAQDFSYSFSFRGMRQVTHNCPYSSSCLSKKNAWTIIKMHRFYSTSHPWSCMSLNPWTLYTYVTYNDLASSASRKIICVLATRVQCSTIPHLGVNSSKAPPKLALHCMKVKSEAL